MIVGQRLLAEPGEAAAGLASLAALDPDLVLAFGAPAFFEGPQVHDALRRHCPRAVIAGCSTAGEISGSRVLDGHCVVTAARFEGARASVGVTRLASMADSFDAGYRIAGEIPTEDLVALFVIGPGVRINGSALVRGMQLALPGGVRVSGGLAADDGAFERTYILGPDGVREDQVVAIGLHGESVRVSYGSYAGWVPFGPARKVTRCRENVLYELDGERALDIYKKYLGEHAAGLPASGLLFPFEMLGRRQEKSGIFRTMLAADEAEGSLTLAGEIDPEGYLKLMHSNPERLVDGAEMAATAVMEGLPDPRGAALALLVSCVGRKLAMGDRIEEEVEAATAQLGAGATVAGFYSNGEIAGTGDRGVCRLPNQTMTITWIGEA